jgi:hypothetical protein
MNHYLCPRDDTRWDAEWSCMANDRCPTCEAVVEPFAMTNAEGSETIYDKQVYNTASVVGNEFGADPTKRERELQSLQVACFKSRLVRVS